DVLFQMAEVHRQIQNQLEEMTIMEQFNPSLRNFISMGKTYEKALASMTYAAKGYFDALVKMGELASESQGSKELGKSPFAAEWRFLEIPRGEADLCPAAAAWELCWGSRGCLWKPRLD
uniref:IMD domain-containing protein n=1 Tax=Zonotrichia albicollis TaxID=44394 RepID=A0A8D2MWH2_ZONAL